MLEDFSDKISKTLQGRIEHCSGRYLLPAGLQVRIYYKYPPTPAVMAVSRLVMIAIS